jgi:NAD(P)-dependent dehydrogenase (short-subunit alcohol dehydrogenase family)
MPSVLITGANRGIGLELARQYAADGWRVHACCRAPDEADALAGIAGEVSLHRLDVEHMASIGALATGLGDAAIDVLVNNAGVYGPEQSFGKVDLAVFDSVMAVNALGPLAVTERLIEHVARGERKLIVCVSSLWGSMGANDWGGHYLYGPSKAALNMIVKSASIDLRARGIAVVAMSPGWVRTDMGGANANLSPEESVASMRWVIADLGIADTGRFMSHDGRDTPW